ncbi:MULTISPECIES: ChaB family protein [Prauserella salsuginis group]|uniref:ChaB family protein n=1 Tax=Prauserella salsuginis TaxID=387889 RepID=A0ABW6G3G3_9PSEU|nr:MULTISPECIES: ChaB family protein [Prauserella salsuginis group]MCR3718584.1 Rho termination factor, N-terminal domain [Prauserella flava]MCR3733154.1 Rho termination factor, N-terminal domain [Prauserella salsuginis]
MPGRRELPGTVRRSSEKAQRTWIKAHDSAVEEYGEGPRAHRTAFAALKRGYEKVGDRWKAKRRHGPSDTQAERGGAGRQQYATAGGVDTRAPKRHLYERAKELDIRGRATMTKQQLVNALQRASRLRTARSRDRSD